MEDIFAIVGLAWIALIVIARCYAQFHEPWDRSLERALSWPDEPAPMTADQRRRKEANRVRRSTRARANSTPDQPAQSQRSESEKLRDTAGWM